MRSALAALLALAAAAGGCAPREEVPTYTVVRDSFRHQVTAEGTLKAADVTNLTVPMEVMRVRLAWLSAEGPVEEGDLVASFDPKEMEKNLEEGRRDQESAGHEVRKSRLQSATKKASFETNHQVADLELGHARRFQKTDEDVFSRHDIVESQIDEKLAGKRKDHAATARETQETLGRTEIEILEIKKRRAQIVIDQAEKGLKALEVRAPHAGILTHTRNWRGDPPEVGGEMYRGQSVAEIPDLGKMEAEVFVLEADAGGLEVDKTATVILEAHPERGWPAKIHRVDAMAKPRFRGSPVQYFGVTLELEDGETISKKPGQRVRATLLLAEVDDALVVPRQAIFEEQGGHRAYVRDGGGWDVRTVEVGAKSMGLWVVTSGLEEGDAVALREPSLPAEDGDGGSEEDADGSVAAEDESREGETS